MPYVRGLVVVGAVVFLLVGTPGPARAQPAGTDLPPPVVRDPAAPTAAWSAPSPARPVAAVSPATTPAVRRTTPAAQEPILPAAPGRWSGVTVARSARPTYRRMRDPYDVARGPVEIRDEWLLAQPRLTLPAVSPDPIACGRWRLRLHFDWGNDFGFVQYGQGPGPGVDNSYMVDGEHRTLEVGARYGLRPDLDVGLRIPLRWRGAGFLDDVIDFWHETTGLLDNDRSLFPTNIWRVEGSDDTLARYTWDHGIGLGNVELEAHWAFLRPASRRALRAALVGRVGIPTGTGVYETGSVEAGLQIAAAFSPHRRWDVYGGVGGTWFSEDTIDAFEYETWRGHAFLAVEWRAGSRVSLLLQTDASTRLITNLRNYPAEQWYVYVGSKIDLQQDLRLALGFTENLADQQSTIDFGVWAGLEWTL